MAPGIFAVSPGQCAYTRPDEEPASGGHDKGLLNWPVTSLLLEPHVNQSAGVSLSLAFVLSGCATLTPELVAKQTFELRDDQLKREVGQSQEHFSAAMSAVFKQCDNPRAIRRLTFLRKLGEERRASERLEEAAAHCPVEFYNVVLELYPRARANGAVVDAVAQRIRNEKNGQSSAGYWAYQRLADCLDEGQVGELVLIPPASRRRRSIGSSSRSASRKFILLSARIRSCALRGP